MIKYLYLFLALCCFPHNNAYAMQVFNGDDSFQIAAAVKLGRGTSDVGLSAKSTVKPMSVKPTAASPSSCKAGYFLSGASCKKCPAGTYSSDGVSCLDCPVGYYNSKTGQSACTPCPAGKYAAGTGNTTCSICPAGQYSSAEASSACTPCEPGKYQSEKGKTSCTACAKGTYAAGSGNTSCLDCIEGTYASSTGNAACDLCPEGYYASDTGNSSCVRAAAGSYATGAGNYDSTACPKGTYQPNAAQGSCIPCAAGTYTSGTGKTSCTNASAGYYAAGTGNTDQTKCPAGTYASNAGSGYCDFCPAGTYNNKTGQSSCTACPSGQTSTGGALACLEKTKTVSVHDAAAAGVHYTTTATSIDDFISKLGDNAKGIVKEYCTELDATISCWCNYYGNYFTFGNMANCYHYTSSFNLDSSQCTNRYEGSPCPVTMNKGKYYILWRDWEDHISGDPHRYTQIYYDAQEYGLAINDPIAELKIAMADSTWEWNPSPHYEMLCAIDKEAATIGYFTTRDTCKAFDNRMAATYYGGNKGTCTLVTSINGKTTGGCQWKWNANGTASCPAGQYSEGGKPPCTQCPAGYYCTGGTSKTQCPAGTYSNAGATESTQCTSCPENTYSTGGASSCTACPAGTTSPAGATSSSQCVNNTKTVRIADPYSVATTTTTLANAAAYEASLTSAQKVGLSCSDSSGNIYCTCGRDDRSLTFKTLANCNSFKSYLGIPYSCTTNYGRVCEASMNVNGADFYRIARDSDGNTSSKLKTSDLSIYSYVYDTKTFTNSTCTANSGLEVTCTAGRGPNREYYFYDASKMGNKMQELMQSGNTIVYYGSYQGGFFTYYIEPAY